MNDNALRPNKFDDVIGQRKVIDRLRVAVEATKTRGGAFGHLLLDGPPGLGKTTLATSIPAELGVRCHIVAAPSIKSPKDLIPLFSNIEANDVIFIDEIHRLPIIVEEFLYPAMEDQRLDIVVGQRTVGMRLKPFSLIGATTRLGLLSTPLMDRFVYRETLDYYSVRELAIITYRNAEKLGCRIEKPAAISVAERSQGTPRKANGILLRMRDYATLEGGNITQEIAERTFDALEIDEIGLERLHREYLETLIKGHKGGPAGVKSMASSLSTSTDTLENSIEPLLMRQGLIIRTDRGRVASPEAYEHLRTL